MMHVRILSSIYYRLGFRGGISLTDLLCLHCIHKDTNKCIMNNYVTCFLCEKNVISGFNIFFLLRKRTDIHTIRSKCTILLRING